MRSGLSRLLAVGPGEGRKTALLYALHLVFYVGLFWGEQSSEALFLSSWGANNLAITFVGTALLSLAVAAIYLPLADRWSNERILQLLTLVLLVWLGSVRLLLLHAGSGRSPAYPYFYVVYSSARDLSTLVILNYINDFYDTRAAKRIIPLMLSAGVAGSAIAGFSNPLLGLTIGVGNVPLAWIACLLVSLTLIRVIHARFPLAATGTPGRTVQPAGRTGASAGGSLRARLGYMRGSPLLRWLAVATFAMVVLMRLLNVESSRVFVQAFSSRPQALFEFYGLFGGVISVLGFVLQSLVVGRLVTAFGVGGIYLLFPSIALGAAGLLGALPTFGAAVGGRLTYTVLKQSFRNPLDALIFNSVPARVKNGAKALVNGVVVPLGVLFAGVFLLLVQPLHGAAAIVGAASIVVAAAYLCASLKVRGAYAGALAALVADGSVAACLEHADLSDFERPNPALKPVLERHLASERNESMVAFLAELLLDLWGHEALPAVLELLQTRGPSIRAAVLELLSRDGSWPAAVRDACLAGLRDEEPGVRSAAAVAAARMPGLERDPARVCALRAVLQEPSTDEARAAALTALVRLPDARTWPDVQAVLDGWLAPDAAERVRILALDVLAGSSDPRLAPALAAAAVAPSAELRRHAAVTAGALEDGDVLNHGLLELISRLAHDEDASVRLAAVPVLQRIGAAAIEPLRTLLGDPDVEVRRAACRAFPRGQVARLVPLLEGENRVLRESAAYVLARVRGRRMRPQLHSAVQLQVEQAQRRASLAVALASLDSPAAVALRAALAERADESCAQALWLLDADSDERALRGIADALRSEDQSTRANALEALEAATSPALARLLGPLLSDKRPTEVQIAAGAALGALLPALPRSEPQRRPVDLVEPLDGDGWLAALAIETALAAADELGGRVVLRRILQECLDDPRALVRDGAYRALRRLDGGTHDWEQPSAMTSVERAIFLKGLPLFAAMPMDRIRALAGIAEEASFREAEQIYALGERGDCLYVVVRGRVALEQRAGRRQGSVARLAALGIGEYFGEASLFDNALRETDAVALEPTETLIVRREPFAELIRRYPYLALDLLSVLSRRLQDASATLAAKTPAKPKELVRLYDKF